MGEMADFTNEERMDEFENALNNEFSPTEELLEGRLCDECGNQYDAGDFPTYSSGKLNRTDGFF